jgi:hypothetical protein
LRRDTGFYLLGWTPSTTDAHDSMYNLMATPTDKGQGQFNLGWYSNPKFDDLALKIQSETDDKKRNEYIREAFKIHQDDVGHIPLHQQALAWGVSNKVNLVQLPDNRMFFKWIGEAGVVTLAPRRSRPRCPAAGARAIFDGDVWPLRAFPVAMVAAVLATICIARALLANVIAPHDTRTGATLELAQRLPPAWMADGKAKYLFGTDDQGATSRLP